jgi:hypothetical protein
VVTTSSAHLIVISSRAFAGLMEKFPAVAEDLRKMAESRARQNSEPES